MNSLKPDDHLDPRQFSGMNERFYTAHPADYFRIRIQMLLLAMGRADDVAHLLAEGVTWREIKFRTTPASFETPDEDAARRLESAGIADAEVIYHHVVECLLRLVIAHVGIPPCPPLEIARIRLPGDFKRRVENQLADRDLVDLADDLWPVFYGSDEVIQSLDPQPDPAEVEEARVATARWVQRFAQTWLDRAGVYNTAKHGLAISAGEGGFSLGPMGPSELKLERWGSIISYIDVVGEPGDRRWGEHMVFAEPDESLACSLTATRMVEQLWWIGHQRYVRATRPGTLRLFKDDLQKLDEARHERLGTYQMQGMTMELLYLPERPDPWEDSDGGPVAPS